MMSELSPRLDTSDASCDSAEERMDLFEASSYLYDALISPFESELRTNQTLQIYCHDVRLMSLPWSALTTTGATMPLFEKYKLSIIPPMCNITPCHAADKNTKIVHVDTLETKDEITGSYTVSNKMELLDIFGKEESIWISLDMKSENELQLADEKICVKTMFETCDFHTVLLVVLDSPHSAQIAHALVNAGVKCVIYPLWKLPKTAIRELVGNIEGNLETMDPIGAMQDAQLKQKNGKQFKDSSFWSAWISIVSY